MDKKIQYILISCGIIGAIIILAGSYMLYSISPESLTDQPTPKVQITGSNQDTGEFKSHDNVPLGEIVKCEPSVVFGSCSCEKKTKVRTVIANDCRFTEEEIICTADELKACLKQ